MNNTFFYIKPLNKKMVILLLFYFLCNENIFSQFAEWSIHSGFSKSTFHPSFDKTFQSSQEQALNGYFFGLTFRLNSDDYIVPAIELVYEKKGVEKIMLETENVIHFSSFNLNYLSLNLLVSTKPFKKIDFFLSPGLGFNYLLSGDMEGYRKVKNSSSMLNFSGNNTNYFYDFDLSPIIEAELKYFKHKDFTLSIGAYYSYGLLNVIKKDFPIKNLSMGVIGRIYYNPK